MDSFHGSAGKQGHRRTAILDDIPLAIDAGVSGGVGATLTLIAGREPGLAGQEFGPLETDEVKGGEGTPCMSVNAFMQVLAFAKRRRRLRNATPPRPKMIDL